MRQNHCSRLRIRALSFATTMLVLASFTRAQTCPPGWLPTLSPPIADVPSFRSLVAFDDGAGGGTALYASGAFTSVVSNFSPTVANVKPAIFFLSGAGYIMLTPMSTIEHTTNMNIA